MNPLIEFANSIESVNPTTAQHVRGITRAMRRIRLPDWVSSRYDHKKQCVTLTADNGSTLQIVWETTTRRASIFAFRNGFQTDPVGPCNIVKVVNEWFQVENEDRKRPPEVLQIGWSSPLGGGGFELVR